jgi:hypothetical protein
MAQAELIPKSGGQATGELFDFGKGNALAAG